MDLKNDIALQRLIAESHILSDAQRKEGSPLSSNFLLNPVGKARLKTLDASIQSLALLHGGDHRNAKFQRNTKDPYSFDPSALVQHEEKKFNSQKMPMNMRKGIVAKKEERTEKYERKSRDAGIILPKGLTKKKSKNINRDRGLTVTSVGKFTKSGLVVSQQEHARIKRR